ncbi:MAG TPA: hypothetical protein VIG46_08985 [Candidatus Baltobacteraceae bacterium]|jgi:UDP-3-O-[3-hydroxymyristoyl] glucosamine N-acyltransferase
MIFSSGTKKPKIHSSAYVAPTAVISGDVEIGSGCAILHGAVITAEGAPLRIGSDTVVMENAVLKASGGSATTFPLEIGERCIVGPGAYVVGATVGEGCFIAGGSRLGNGATMADGASNAPYTDPSFFAEIFNVDDETDLAGRAAEAYAKFLRKTHAQDARLDEHKNVKPAPRRSVGEEPPPTQAADVGGVVDAMMLELQEMEHRRQDSIKKQRP